MMAVLLRIKRNGWMLEVVGKRPELPPFVLNPSSLETEIVVDGQADVEAIKEKDGGLILISSSEKIFPVFFEDVAYDFHLEKESDEKVLLSLPNGSELRRQRKNSEHHTLNFRSSVGFSEICVEDSIGLLKVRFEVFPRKIDYRDDYLKMKSEVSSIVRNLAMAGSTRTFSYAAPDRKTNPTLVEWFSLIKEYFKSFCFLAKGIEARPHSKLKPYEKQVRSDRAKRLSRRSLEKAIRRGKKGIALPNKGISVPHRVTEKTSALTYDTPENRYFKWILEETYRKITALCEYDFSENEDANHPKEKEYMTSIKPDLIFMKEKIGLMLNAKFLKKVKCVESVRPSSMVFNSHPLYSRFDRVASIINSGLSFSGDIIPIGLKDTALLYEYWCFLKVVDILKSMHDLESQSVVKHKKFRLSVSLTKGRSSAIVFRERATGKRFYLVYNRLFKDLPTISQKPDNVIQIASEEKFYILDAKYRVQFDQDYIFRYGGSGPKVDDINTMHRYRDAIALPHPVNKDKYISGVVEGAVVLFPFKDESVYESHQFYKSIEKVGIGGLPFIPSATQSVEKMLENVIRKNLL